MSATAWRRVQLAHILACLALIWPAVTYWRNSVPFLVGISMWALVAGALSGWMAARAEESAVDRADLEPIMAAQARIEAMLATLTGAAPPVSSTPSTARSPE